MKTSEIFRAAKKNLWDGVSTQGCRPRQICYAIEVSVRGRKQKERARRITMERLDECRILENWLEKQGIEWEDMSAARVQAHRHAWLDLLIAEFEAKGD